MNDRKEEKFRPVNKGGLKLTSTAVTLEWTCGVEYRIVDELVETATDHIQSSVRPDRDIG